MPMSTELSVEQTEALIIRRLREHNVDIKSAFIKIDTARNGHVSAEELRRALQDYSLEITPEMSQKIVRKYDKTGQFDYDEFAHFYEGPLTTYLSTYAVDNTAVYAEKSLLRGQLGATHQTLTCDQQSLFNLIRTKIYQHGSSGSRSRHLSQIFTNFDQDRNGYLSYSEIHYGLHMLQIDLTSEQLLSLTDIMDPNHTGQIHLYDFLGFLQGSPCQGKGGGGGGSLSSSLSFEEEVPQPATKLSELNQSVGLREVELPHVYEATIQEGDTDKKALQKIVAVFEEKKMKLLHGFHEMDKTGSGKVGLQNFVNGLQTVGIDITEPRAKRLLRKYDFSGDGLLEYNEFVRMISSTLSECNTEDIMCLDSPKASDETDLCILKAISNAVYEKYSDTHKAFMKMDRDGSKRVGKDEFKNQMCRLGVELSDAEVDGLFSKFNKNHTGSLRYCEFLRMLAASGARQ